SDLVAGRVICLGHDFADTRLAGAFAWLERDARSHAPSISLALQRVLLRSLTAKSSEFLGPMEYRGSLQLSRRRQGGVDAFDGSELRFPEGLRFHFFQVGVGIAEIRPDVFLVGEEAFLFGARAHVQDVHFAAAAEYALEPATELGRIHGAATLGEVGQHGRI